MVNGMFPMEREDLPPSRVELDGDHAVTARSKNQQYKTHRWYTGTILVCCIPMYIQRILLSRGKENFFHRAMVGEAIHL